MTALVAAKQLALPGRLEPTDLYLQAGQLTCLVGPNGSGKTSLLHAIGRIGGPKGEVSIAGIDPAKVPPSRRGHMLSYLAASRDIAWPLIAHDLVALGQPEDVSPARIAETLSLFGLDSLADRRVDRLSTGERSRLLIARVLAADATLLLLDEPIANLDPLWQLRLLDHLRSMLWGANRAVLVAMHDLEMARRYADRLLIMNEGRIVADGEPAALLASDHITAVFGIVPSASGWQPSSPEDPRS